jgi:DNA-binding winged helix-turn-helix (wHTH) protein
VPLRFANVTFDAEARELRVEGAREDVSPRAFLLLELLLGARPRAVSKDELMARLWPGEVVSESSLPRLVAELRCALGDDAREPRFIRTLHTFGYAFCAPAETLPEGEPSEPAPFRLVWGDRQIPLRPGENLLGRDAEARVAIDLARVSRRHARIVITEDRAVLEDLASKNGTFVGGKRVVAPMDLSEGDEIAVGPAVLVFRRSVSTSTTQTGSAAER